MSTIPAAWREAINDRLSASLDPSDLSRQYDTNFAGSDAPSWTASSVACVVHERNGSAVAPAQNQDDYAIEYTASQQQRCSDCGRCHILGCLSAVTVEPAIFVHMLVTSIESIVLSNLVLHKVCAFDMGLPDSECLVNMSNKTVEDAMQVHAARANMYINFADTFPGVMMSFLMGAYSDRRGRKFPVIAPILGYILSSILFAVVTYYDEAPIWCLCLAVLPRAFGGGLIAFNSSCLSYVSDISTSERRTERVALVEAALFIGTPIGTIVGGYLSAQSFAVYAYVVGAVLDIAVVIYLTLVVRNRPLVTGSPFGVGEHLLDFFDLSSVKLTLSTVFKNRPNNGRKHLLLLLATLLPHLIAFFGTMSVTYLYVRLKYSWDIQTFSYYSAFSICAVAVGLALTLAIFVRWLHVSDIWLCIGGTISSILHNISIALSVNTLTLYLAIIPAAFSSVGMLSIRSMISKLIPSEEQGKVFSVSSSLDALAPLITSVAYNELYTATIVIFPAACFVLSASVLTIPLFLLTIIYVDYKVRDSFRTWSYLPIEP